MSTEMAHMSDSVWDNRTPGIWYGEVIIERPDGETDYVYAYSNVQDYAPDVELLIPDGCTYLEHSLYLTGHGKWTLRDDPWMFDEQTGPDKVTHEEYWANGLRP